MKRIVFRWQIWAVVATTLAFVTAAHACNVPVFRFALEHWRPDPYRVVVFHRGELNESQRQSIRSLEEQQDNSLANLSVSKVDLADDKTPDLEKRAADRALYEALGKPELPWLVVQYPEYLRIPKPAWAGPLKDEVVKAAVDSPVRRELARRLAEGQTAVWLLLETGDAEKDEAASKLVQQELKRLERDLQLPELTDSPADALATTLPLEVKFSLLRVPRNVPAEHALVAMLIGSEADLAERSDPMLFAVFGRGRALLPFIGAGITSQNIQDAAGFLAGPCSCEVKEQNPGFDLMLAADWESLLSEHGVALAAVETKATAAPQTTEPQLVPIPTGAPPAAPKVTKAARLMERTPQTASQAVQNSVLDTLVSTPMLVIGGSLIAGLVVITIGLSLTQSRRRA